MPAREEDIALLKERLDHIIDIDHPSKLSRPELGEAHFKDAIPLLNQMISLFQQIRSSHLPRLPRALVQNMNARTENILKWLAEAEGFDLKRSDPVRQRDDMIQNLENEWMNLLSEAGSYISYLASSQTSEAMRKREEAAEESLKNIQRYSQEAVSSLQAQRQAIGETGVAKYLEVFGEQAEEDGSAATRWLKWATTFGVVCLGFAWWALFTWDSSAETIGEIIRDFGGRLTILTLLLFALGFAIRQYGISKHNQTLNLNRQNALRTFETFVSAAGSPETKDSVLLEATRSIFSPQPSGFLKGRNDTETPSAIIRVVEQINSGTQGKP